MRKSVSFRQFSGLIDFHFAGSNGLDCYLTFDDVFAHLDTSDPGQLVVELRKAAENILRGADMLNGRMLDANAATARERAAYGADLADLRVNSPLTPPATITRMGGECS